MSSVDFGDPRDNVYAFAKMWATFADEPVLGCYHGTMFASVGVERLRPLFGYAGTGLMQARLLDDGRVRLRGKETGFFTDLATGAVLRAWDNPYTGERVEVFDFLNDRVRGVLGLTMPRFQFGTADDEPSAMHAGVPRAAGTSAGDVPFVLPWQVYGDQVLLEWDYTHRYSNPVDPARWPRASTGPVVNPSEHFCFVTSYAQLADRARPSAEFTAGFSRLSPWWPWMRMGGSGVDGVLFGRMFSRKTRRGLDDVPPAVRAHVERHHPEYLEAPTDWDDGSPIGTWEAYARDVPPEV